MSESGGVCLLRNACQAHVQICVIIGKREYDSDLKEIMDPGEALLVWCTHILKGGTLGI